VILFCFLAFFISVAEKPPLILSYRLSQEFDQCYRIHPALSGAGAFFAETYSEMICLRKDEKAIDRLEARSFKTRKSSIEKLS